MIFTDLYKSPKSPLSRLRHAHHPALAPGAADYDADLLSKDKTRQKLAVKKHLQTKVRNDWAFAWPPEAPTAHTSGTNPEGASDQAPSGDLEGFLEVASQDVTSNVDESSDRDGAALDVDDESDSDWDAKSVYSVVSEDPLHWKARLEWTSELSDNEPHHSPLSPFRYDTPESIGQAITASKLLGKARRRKELRQEIAWNDGLACFEARRNAWTGAKVARVRPKPMSPTSATSPKRGLFWRTHTHSSTSPTLPSPLTPTNSQPDAAGPGADSESSDPNEALSPKSSRGSIPKDSESLPVETLLPIPLPLLPPANPMRASIQPQIYNSIYEKVVVNSLQPSCPINLSDMIRACVAGWKRDGEWPPRSSVPEPASVVAVRRKKSSRSAAAASTTQQARDTPAGRKLSFSFLSGRGGHDGSGDKHERDKTRRESAAGDDGHGSGGSGTSKAFRKSIQKVLGLGHSPTLVGVGDEHAAVGDGHGVA